MAVFKVAGDNLLDRIQNAQSLLTIVKANEAQRLNEEENKIFKGLFYVVLYGAIEQCLMDCVSIFAYHDFLSVHNIDARFQRLLVDNLLAL